MKLLTCHITIKPSEITFKEQNQILDHIGGKNKILETILEDVHIDGVISNFYEMDMLNENNKRYQELYNKIINVGEYDIVEK